MTIPSPSAPDMMPEDQSPPHVPVVELINQLIVLVQELIAGQVALFKVKVKKAVKKLGAGAVLVALGALFGLYLLFWVFRSIEMLLALAVAPWAASLLTALIILLLLILFVSVGAALLKRGSREIPDVPNEVKVDVDAVKEGFGK